MESLGFLMQGFGIALQPENLMFAVLGAFLVEILALGRVERQNWVCLFPDGLVGMVGMSALWCKNSKN